MLIKAAAGGGGKGMRVARDEKELTRLFPLARAESEAAFGSRTMYLEKYLEHARHVEFQILADNHRNVIHLGERDCSIQRRHQKVLEEAPCPVMTPRLREKMGKAAVRAAQVVGYSNVGTVEFLLSADGDFYFIEMNTRIQVEHGVTEMVTGGRPGASESIWRSRWASGCGSSSAKSRSTEPRWSAAIYAEDPDTHLPSPGVVSNHHPPGGLGVRVESALYDGYRVPVHYDPLIAKLIVHAGDRAGVDRARTGGAARVPDGRHQDQHSAPSADFAGRGFSARRVRHRFSDPLRARRPRLRGYPRRGALTRDSLPDQPAFFAGTVLRACSRATML